MTSPAHTVVIGRHLSLEDVAAVARAGTPIALDAGAAERMDRARARLLAGVAQGRAFYGVNTGFGALSETRIADDQLDRLQVNLLRSHAMGVGQPLPREVVRALLALRAHTLALGCSGASAAVVRGLLSLHAADLIPRVPSQGSVGASGDLAPLAHLALPLIGEGELEAADGSVLPARQALAAAGLSPLQLGPKEGLSLINGTQVTTAIGALAVLDARHLALAADILGALSLDAHLGSVRVCDPRIHAGKPHPGQRRSAETIAALLEGSALLASHENCGRVQDAYSFRCMPQVHGAARHALAYVARALEIEIDSATDNPLVLAGDGDDFDVISGGNFHAGSVALPLDHATAALTTLATMSERRCDRFMAPESSRGLPAFLAGDPGLESGLMMAQVTAAALASECKVLSHPACVDTIPTSAGKEDHVSMGPIAARKLRAVVDNLARILAIEAITATRALSLREHATSPRLTKVAQAIEAMAGAQRDDRSLAPAIEAIAFWLCRGELTQCAGLDAAEV